MPYDVTLTFCSRMDAIAFADELKDAEDFPGVKTIAEYYDDPTFDQSFDVVVTMRGMGAKGEKLVLAALQEDIQLAWQYEGKNEKQELLLDVLRAASNHCGTIAVNA